MNKKKYITVHDIGKVVKTPYGLGILFDIDAGAAFYVKPLNKNKEWETCQFVNDELRLVTK